MKYSLKGLFVIILFPFFSQAVNAQWIQMHVPESGSVNCFAVSGQNIFAGVGQNGVFLSTDNGSSWKAVNYGFTRSQGTVNAMAAIGKNVFAGFNNGSGVFLSTNNGASWKAVNNGLPLNVYISSLAVYSAGTGDTNIFIGTIYSGGVYRSTNKGLNWSPVNNGFPENKADIYSIIAAGSGLYAATSSSGIFRSTNNGTDWTYCGFKDTTVLSLASRGGNIYAGTFIDGLFVSTDNGASWRQSNLYAANINALMVSGTNLFAGTGQDGIYMSADNGIHWNSAAAGLPPCWVKSFASFPNGSGGYGLLAGTEQGIFFSSDNGSAWAESNAGLTGTTLNVLAASDANVFAGTDCGVFFSSDNGDNWNSVNNGLRGARTLGVNSLKVSGSDIFAGVMSFPQTGVYLSPNYGRDWNYIGNNITMGLPSSFEIYTSGKADTIVFAGCSNGLFRTSDRGLSWTLMNIPVSYSYALATSRDASGGLTIYAGTWGEGIYRSSDDGNSWTPITGGLPEKAYVNALKVSGNNLLAALNMGLYIYNNNGTGWAPVNSDLQKRAFYSMITYGQYILAGTDVGVILSADHGISWSNISGGSWYNSGIFPMATAGEYIYISDGNGIWRRKLSEVLTAVENLSGRLPLEFNLEQNYPNPFNPDTFIKFSIPEDQFVTLKVYDIQGREVAALINEEKSLGSYSIKFQAENLPSGIYICRLKAGEFVKSAKMILLK